MSRALLRAAIAGKFDDVDYIKDEVWGVDVPLSGPQETNEYLHPLKTWGDENKFWTSAQNLHSQLEPKLVELGLSDVIGTSVAQRK